jgi:long-chain acyl-CoA synthetase
VLRHVRDKLGCDRLRYFVSGGAMLHLDVALTFAAADIMIMEGYGLTECSSVVTVNHPGAYRIGSVGPPIPHVEIAVGDDGEIAVHGPTVMLGYYRQPEATAAVLRDGWFSTGDIGAIDRNGYLRIVDRKKEIFKTSRGKYVVPARVESAIARSPYVAQVVVIGNGREHTAALVVPNWATLRMKLNLPDGATPAELAARGDVRAFFIAECRRETRDLADFEQVRWVGVLPRDLSIDDGELTPTLKVRRRIVEERYAALVPEFTPRSRPATT